MNSQECMVADIEDYFAERRGSPELQKYQTSHNRVQGTFLQDFVSTSKLYIIMIICTFRFLGLIF